METKTEMTNGFYLMHNSHLGRVKVCRRGVILAYANDTETAITKAVAYAQERGIRTPTVK